MSKYGRQKQQSTRRAASAAVQTEPLRWQRPPPEACRPPEPAATYGLSSTSRIVQRQVHDDRGIVDYAVMHEVRASNGMWFEIVRIDCSHGEVHVHMFFAGQETREVIRSIYSQKDVIDTVQESYDFVFEKWEEHERRWQSG